MRVGKIFSAFFSQPVFNPATLNPFLWIDAVNGDYVSSQDNNGTRQPGNIIDSASDEMGKALTIGAVGTKPIFNGVGWFFETSAQISQGVASDWNFLHNGNDFAIYLTYFQCPATASQSRVLMHTNGVSNTARGMFLQYDNTSSLNALKLRIGNGTGTVISITANSAITQNAVNKIKIIKSGNTVTVYVNGSQVGTHTNTGWNVSDSVNALSVCSSGSTARTYLLDLFIKDGSLTSDQLAQMDGRSFSVPACSDINVYIFAGDSNASGRGDNVDIAADLTGAIPGAYSETFNSSNPASSTSWIGKLEVGINQSNELITSYHGSEMRFCKEIGTLQNMMLLKYAIGSTSLMYNWNISLSGQEYDKCKTSFTVALIDLVHSKRMSPVFKGFIWIQGANDANVGGDNLSWTRSGTTITVTQTSHPRSTGQSLPVVASSDLTALPLGDYVMTKIDANTFTIQGVNDGGASGTMTYSGGSKYKTLFTDLFNAILDFISGSLLNEATNSTGYTIDKMRLFMPQTKFDAVWSSTSYNDVIDAQADIGNNYRTDNPTYASMVIGTHTESTDDIPGGVHYTTAGYDTLGDRISTYFSQYVNE
jgi:hypothetical protein